MPDFSALDALAQSYIYAPYVEAEIKLVQKMHEEMVAMPEDELDLGEAWRWSLDERKAFLSTLPWVDPIRAGEEVPCQGIKWGTVALRDIFAWGPGESRPPRGIQDRSRCRLRARWRYEAHPDGDAVSGAYCWHHLWVQVHHHPADDDRMLLAWDERPGGR